MWAQQDQAVEDDHIFELDSPPPHPRSKPPMTLTKKAFTPLEMPAPKPLIPVIPIYKACLCRSCKTLCSLKEGYERREMPERLHKGFPPLDDLQLRQRAPQERPFRLIRPSPKLFHQISLMMYISLPTQLSRPRQLHQPQPPLRVPHRHKQQLLQLLPRPPQQQHL